MGQRCQLANLILQWCDRVFLELLQGLKRRILLTLGSGGYRGQDPLVGLAGQSTSYDDDGGNDD